jgi:hypothetical protein
MHRHSDRGVDLVHRLLEVSLKSIVRTLSLLLAFTTVSFAGVTINEPANGGVTNSPLHVRASATAWGSAPVKVMQVYLDGALIYNRAGNALDAYFNVASGGHNVVVKAWDSVGGASSSAVKVTASGAGIVLNSPAPDTTVSSSVRILAQSYAPFPITGMKVYDNGHEIISAPGPALDKTISLASGPHYLVTQAWDSKGTVYRWPANVQVGTGTPAPSTPPSTQTSIPSNAVKKADIDQMTGWQHCDVCAGIGGAGPQTAYSMTQFVKSPSLDGNSVNFWLGGSTPYSNALWWKQLGAVDSASHFVYDMKFYFTDLAAVQALEFDVNQSVNGLKYIFGTECSVRNNNGWRVWDTQNKQWIKTGATCSLKANEWNRLTWEFERVGSRTHFIAVTLNGTRQVIDRYFYARGVGTARELNVAFQMDGNYQQADYSVWGDQISLYYW